jgi:hypothetical protein
MSFASKASIAAAAAAFVVAGCGGGGGVGGSGSPSTMGTLNVSLTDAPACGYDGVNVTVQKVRVHQSQGATDADTGWSEVVLSPARRIDLLSLTNAGKYTQLRLVLADNGSAAPFANSVVPSGGAETALDTPSATQSGLKMNVDIDVAADKIADVVLDFDACKSVVKRGNSGQFNLKPVISVTPVVSDAGLRVIGYVDPAIGTATTQVSLQSASLPVKATVPDASGKFVLYPVPAGSYDLVVAASGHVTAVMTGVPVTTTAFTTVNSAAVPISPASAATRSVAGTVTPATATVRATQTLSGGPKVEVAWGAVDPTSGAFGFALPIEAPIKTGYVANPATLAFAADAAAAAKYTLEASSAGSTKTQAINVSAAVPAVTFSFP